MNQIFTSTEAAFYSGVPVATVDSWTRIDFLPPSVRRANGRGSRNTYNFRDIVALVVVRELRPRIQDLSFLLPTVVFIRLDDRLDLEALNPRDCMVVGDTGGLFMKRPPSAPGSPIEIKEPIAFGDGLAAMDLMGPPPGENVQTVSWINLYKIVNDLRRRIEAGSAGEGGDHGKAAADAGASGRDARDLTAPGAPARA